VGGQVVVSQELLLESEMGFVAPDSHPVVARLCTILCKQMPMGHIA
jgi:hypothetical protein